MTHQRRGLVREKLIDNKLSSNNLLWSKNSNEKSDKFQDRETNRPKDLWNKPDQTTMRPDCVSACIDFGARLGQTDRRRHSIKRGFQNIVTTWYVTSSWLKSAENCKYKGGAMDGRTDGRTDRPTDLLRGQADEPTGGRTERWTDGPTDRRTYKLSDIESHALD